MMDLLLLGLAGLMQDQGPTITTLDPPMGPTIGENRTMSQWHPGSDNRMFPDVAVKDLRIDGDTLYVHGSTGARSLRAAAGGESVCVNVTLLDGVVYGRSVFHNSVNYRSAVIHGQATSVTEPEAKLRGLRVLTEHLAPGSWDYARPPTDKEMAKTAVLALDLGEAAVKIRTGPPVDDDEDVATDAVWAGVLPLRAVWGDPQPCPLLAGRHAVPPHLLGRTGPV